MSATAAVLGLGPMGSALAGAFLRAGHRTVVWNRTPARAAPLAERGALTAGTAAAAVAASPLTVLCLTDYAAVRELTGALAAPLAGRTLVNLTSGSPVDARETAAWAERHGIAYLDGVIMTTTPGIGSPDVLQLYGGPRTAFDGARDTLAALGDPVHLGSDPALSSVYDTALLSLLWGTLTGWLHGTALIGADGAGGNVPAADFTAVAERWLRTVGGFMGSYARQIDAGRYPGGDFPLRLHQRTLDILAHASELRGIAPDLPEFVRAFIRPAVEAGHGGDSYARLIEFLRPDGPEAAPSPPGGDGPEAGTRAGSTGR